MLTTTKILDFPTDGLPGSLSLTHRRCGKPTCHCVNKLGHPMWSLTYMAGGTKHVERIPKAWVEDVRRRVNAARAFKGSVAEALVANAQELVYRRRCEGLERDRAKRALLV